MHMKSKWSSHENVWLMFLIPKWQDRPYFHTTNNHLYADTGNTSTSRQFRQQCVECSKFISVPNVFTNPHFVFALSFLASVMAVVGN